MRNVDRCIDTERMIRPDRLCSTLWPMASISSFPFFSLILSFLFTSSIFHSLIFSSLFFSFLLLSSPLYFSLLAPPLLSFLLLLSSPLLLFPLETILLPVIYSFHFTIYIFSLSHSTITIQPVLLFTCKYLILLCMISMAVILFQ